MQETPQEYTKRMLGQTEGREALKILASTSNKLDRLVKGMPATKLRKRPAPGKWSVVEILAHLADCEIARGWRMRQILSAPGTALQAFDQDAWAASSHYEKRDPRKSLALFHALREADLALLKTLSPEQCKCHGMHAERGAESIEHICRMHAGHDLNHLAQIERIVGKKRK